MPRERVLTDAQRERIAVLMPSTDGKPLLSQLAVKRLGPGHPRTRPDAVLGDKACPSRGSRAMLPERKITAVIPQPSDQIAHRQRRGSAGGRPPAFDAATYKGRNVVERSFNDHGQWRGIATRSDKLATNYRGGAVLHASGEVRDSGRQVALRRSLTEVAHPGWSNVRSRVLLSERLINRRAPCGP